MNNIRKQVAGFGIAIAALVSVAGTQQVKAQTTSDGTTPATGDTVVTMTVPKFAEVSGIPTNVGFAVTSAQYAANTAANAGLIGFKVRTNSTAGLTVQVLGTEGTTALKNTDIVLTSDGKAGNTTLSATAQTIWSNAANIDVLPASNNVTLGVQVNNLNGYTSTGASTYTNTLTFTVLPN